MLEKLETKIKQVQESVKSAAVNYEETRDLNAKIDEAKASIAAAYGEIGEAFYNQSKDAVPEGYEENFAKVASAFGVIDDCALRLKALAGVRVCPSCGADVEKGQRFCCNCGTQVPEEKPEEAAVKYVCEQCGTEAEEGAAFCTNCGAKISPVAVPAEPEHVCKRCGAKLVEGALFCTTCGEKVTE